MIICEIKAQFEELSLLGIKPDNVTVIVPTLISESRSGCGIHTYYFMNFRTSKGICVRIKNNDIVSPGIKRFKKPIINNIIFYQWVGVYFRNMSLGLVFLNKSHLWHCLIQ